MNYSYEFSENMKYLTLNAFTFKMNPLREECETTLFVHVIDNLDSVNIILNELDEEIGNDLFLN